MRRLVLLLPLLLACGLPTGLRRIPVTVTNESGNAMDLIADSVQVLYPHTSVQLLRIPGDSVAIADPYTHRAIRITAPVRWRLWLGSDSVTVML